MEKWVVYVDGKFHRMFDTEGEAKNESQCMGLGMWDQQCQGNGMASPDGIEIKYFNFSDDQFNEGGYYVG